MPCLLNISGKPAFFIFKGNQGGVDLQESRIGESKEEKRDVKLWSEYEGRISK